MRRSIVFLACACLSIVCRAVSPDAPCAALGVCWHDDTWQYPQRWEDVCGARLTLLAGHNRNVSGLDLGIGLNEVGDRMNGLQVAACASEVENTATGLQIAGIGNLARHVLGVQIAGWCNLGPLQGESYGVQIAGVFNSESIFHLQTSEPRATLCGAQLAFLGNSAQRIIGIQAGAINRAVQCGGVQLGVFNRADCLCGLQLGIVNMAGTGKSVQLGLLNFLGTEENQLMLPGVNAQF